MFSIFERQLGFLENQNNVLKNEIKIIKEENEFLKSELDARKSSNIIKPSFQKEIFGAMPLEISEFIKNKAIENDLEGLFIDPSKLQMKNQIGIGGFAKVFK